MKERSQIDVHHKLRQRSIEYLRWYI